MNLKKLLVKLKERWGVDSFWQVGLILFIFSITGMTSLYIRKYAFHVLGFTESTPFWEETIIWILVVFPSYQVLFLVYGFLLGQFDFVWRFEKKSFLRVKKLFVKSS